MTMKPVIKVSAGDRSNSSSRAIQSIRPVKPAPGRQLVKADPSR
jgi:hypothetical protein